MKELISYRTEDGKIFADKGRAIRHEHFEGFLKWYEYRKLSAQGNIVINPGLVYDWLMKNERMILVFFGIEKRI